jgi:hypothetical protein
MSPDPGKSQMSLTECERAYMNDASFRLFVDTLQIYIEKLELTPAEMRSAAMFACLLVERRRPINMIIQSRQSVTPSRNDESRQK